VVLPAPNRPITTSRFDLWSSAHLRKASENDDLWGSAAERGVNSLTGTAGKDTVVERWVAGIAVAESSAFARVTSVRFVFLTYRRIRLPSGRSRSPIAMNSYSFCLLFSSPA